jgi:hypothetical protein
MPNVLTEGSTIQCAHGGTIKPSASQSVLKVDGQKVLVQSDLPGTTVSNCLNVNAPAKPCLTVVSVTAGVSTTLKAGGQPVLLEAALGLTDGVPVAPVQWSVASAGQTKLQAS